MSTDINEYADNTIHRLEGEIRLKDENICALLREVQELKEGTCRYNCRTAKENFLAGMQAGLDDTRMLVTSQDMEKEYSEWKRRQT